MAESRQANVPGNDAKTPGGSSPFEGKSSSSAAVGGMRKTLNSIVPPRYQPLTISALVVAAAGYYLYYGPKRTYHSQNQQQQNSIGIPSPAPVSAPGSGQMAGGQQSVQPGKEVKRGVTEKRA